VKNAAAAVAAAVTAATDAAATAATAAATAAAASAAEETATRPAKINWITRSSEQFNAGSFTERPGVFFGFK
jgi:hypothetical protein